MSKLIHYSGPAGSILLPSGYTRLSYIQFTGSLWIDSGTLSTDVDEIYYELSPDSIPTSGDMHIIANTRSASSNNYKVYGVVQTNGKLKMHYGSTYWDSTTKMVVGSRYIIKGILKESQLKLWINGNLEIDKAITGGPTAGVKNTIGAWNGNGNIHATFKGKIYFAKFLKNGLIVRDFVPVKKSDGTIGLLDLVNNTFYGNSGTRTFIAGPEIPQGFPTSEYCLVEWLEGTGTLWIDTGFKVGANNEFICLWSDVYNASGTKIIATKENKGYGLGNAHGNNPHITGGGRIYGDNIAIWINGSNYFSTVGKNDTNKIFTDTITTTANSMTLKMTGVDGTSYLNSTINNLTTYADRNMYLFRDSSGDYPYLSAKRIYRCYLKSDSTIVYDLVPCYRRSDMKPGMYDLISRTFLTNSGTGEFLLGPSITFGWGEVVNGSPIGSDNCWLDAIALPSVGPSFRTTMSYNASTGKWTNTKTDSKLNQFLLTIQTRNATGSPSTEVQESWYASIYTSTSNRCKHSFTATKDALYITIKHNGSTLDLGICMPFVIKAGYSYTVSMDLEGYNCNVVGGLIIKNIKLERGLNDNPKFNPLHAIPHNISTGDGRNGEKNGAFHFDGTSYMEVDAGSILPANCTKYTIMMWAKVDTSGACALFSQRNLISYIGRCVLYDNTKMYYDDGVRSNFLHRVTLNNWNHYAFVRNGSNKYVYINGKLVNTSSASTAGIFSPVLTIGACLITDSGVVNLFVGDMKDIKIFDTNLDASGIQQEM